MPEGGQRAWPQPTHLGTDMQDRTRIARAFIAALLSTLVAVSLHHAVGGAATIFAAAVCLLLTFWVAVVLMRARLGVLGLSATVLAAQGLIHAVLGVLSAAGAAVIHTQATTALDRSHFASRASDTHTMVHGVGAAHHMGSDPLAPDTPGFSMLLAHALAALITVVLIRHGEQAVSALPDVLLGAAIALVVRVAPCGVLRVRLPRRPADASLPVLAPLTLPRTVRGPPGCAA